MACYSEIVSATDLAACGDAPDVVIVDCRFSLSAPEDGATAYARGHIPGARYAHLERDLSGPRDGVSGRHPLPSRAAFQETLHTLGITPRSQVIAYDDGSGVYASRLWWLLRGFWGHRAVAVLDRGLAGWVAEGRALTADPPVPCAAAPAYPPPAEHEGVWFDTGAVWDELHRPQHRLLLDARGAARYQGTVELIDPVAGHIPGARNRPFEDNLAAHRGFRPAAELRQDFAALLGDREPHEVIHYCGSGVSACHNILAMAIAGYGVTPLYPGSWSAWVSDPARPVARGADRA